MDALLNLFKNTGRLHHAYVIEGEKSLILKDLVHFLKQEVGLEVVQNPDFSLVEFEQFGIHDSRDLRERQLNRAMTGKKIFIVAFRAITVEAQNALLKVLEEPTEDSHFFLVVPRAEVLLPTVRSRVVVVSHQAGEADRPEEKEAKKFLKASVGERLAQIKVMLDEKDKSKMVPFVQALERILAKDGLTKNAAKLAEIVAVEQYLNDRGASMKLLLEHVALVV